MTRSQSTRDILSRRTETVASSDGNRCGRLLSLVVGIDHYQDPRVPDLCCAVNDAESVADAISHTQPAGLLEMIVLTDPSRGALTGTPAREAILAAARELADSAGSADTVLIYFAGHGATLAGRPCLFPADASLAEEGTQIQLVGALAVAELQEVFRDSPCTHRVMFLDCCQNSFSTCIVPVRWAVPESNPVDRALPWRTGLPLSTELFDVFHQSAQGWSLLIACGPNEVSLEDPEWGAHGIFSHFLATGLRGEADLDRDGIVSLPELVQFLAVRIPKQAEAVIDDLRQRGEILETPQSCQNPTVVWSGPIAFPLTRCVDEHRVQKPIGIWHPWLHLLTHRLPYTIALEGMARYGTAVIYGLAMALTAWLFVARARGDPCAILVIAVGATSGMLWLVSFALAGAANEARWHSGGYWSASLMAFWHLAVFALLLEWAVRTASQSALHLAVELSVLLVIMIIFGHNALHCIISLADLIKRDLRVAARRAFLQLERQWIHADIDNMIAMVSAHPRLYQILALAVAILVMGHVTYILITPSHAQWAMLEVARDVVLLLLVQWLVQWYAASFRAIRGSLLPER